MRTGEVAKSRESTMPPTAFRRKEGDENEP